eukprot:721397_1
MDSRRQGFMFQIPNRLLKPPSENLPISIDAPATPNRTAFKFNLPKKSAGDTISQVPPKNSFTPSSFLSTPGRNAFQFGRTDRSGPMTSLANTTQQNVYTQSAAVEDPSSSVVDEGSSQLDSELSNEDTEATPMTEVDLRELSRKADQFSRDFERVKRDIATSIEVEAEIKRKLTESEHRFSKVLEDAQECQVELAKSLTNLISLKLEMCVDKVNQQQLLSKLSTADSNSTS